MLSDVPLHVTMLLADAAQVSENKLNLLGGGWDVTGPQPTPSAIAMIIRVPWDQANTKYHWMLELVDIDGDPVTVETPMGSKETVKVEGDFEVGRPAGVKRGTTLQVPLAINFAPLPVQPGGRYEWRLTIGDESDQDWRLPFNVRPAG
jgi:hypothetical protein